MWSGQGQNLPRGGERVSGEADGFGPILATHTHTLTPQVPRLPARFSAAFGISLFPKCKALSRPLDRAFFVSAWE
jgi:hypothetical protein